jgi:hypothetical protein
LAITKTGKNEQCEKSTASNVIITCKSRLCFSDMRDKANNKIFSTKARILFKIWRMPFDAITIYLTRLSMELSYSSTKMWKRG